jgi:hypothetical protein
MAKFASSAALSVLIFISGSALAQAVPRQCGYDRWPVKTLVDKDRSRVDLTPIDITIAELVAIPIHEIPSPYDHRIAPEELRVFRIKARLLKVKREQDSDLHLLVADLNDPSKRMIAEIPAPDCALGSGHEDEYKVARETIAAVHPNAVLEIIGVGFFDFLHEQKGAAPNGIELHPVLSIRRLITAP